MQHAGRVENFQPHMHLRGKAMSMEAILPDGTTQHVELREHFQFNWHTNYIYADDAAPILPKGTVAEVHRRGTTTQRRTRTIPIRINGSAGATAPSTRWRTRGSTLLI